MSKIRFSYDRKSFLSKPTKNDIPGISKRIAISPKQVSANELRAVALDISLDGHTFCPATFTSGNSNRECFEQQQLFALDFDNKDPNATVSFETVKAKAKRYELPILFAYDTFRSKNHDRFRVVFLNDNSITDIRAAEIMLKALTTVFHEVDTCCQSPIQMYFGGDKELLYFDSTLPEINIESLIRNTTNFLEVEYGATHYKSKLAKFSHDTGISLTKKGQLDVSFDNPSAENTGATGGKNLPNHSIYVPIGRNLLGEYYRINLVDQCTRSLSDKKTTNYHRTYRSNLLGKIGSSCKLFREFESGERRLHHQELFGIATNLIWVESGASRFMEFLREHAYYNHEREYSKWVQDIRYIKGHDYKPKGCDSFCGRYCSTCHHGANILSTVKPLPYQMERIANYDEHFVSLDEACEDFNQKLSSAVASGKKGWHILKAQTALGKTQAILELLTDTSLRVLIAVPTNILKREISSRAESMGLKLTASPSLHELKSDLPTHVWGEIEALLNSGKPTMPYINELIKEDNPECSGVLKKYKREQDAFKETHDHAITTHKRLLTMKTGEYDLVIVDEDIIFNTIIPNKADISIADLKQLKKEVLSTSPLAKKINKIRKYIKENEFFTLKGIPYDKEYADITMEVDIPALCSASRFCYRKDDGCVSFLNPVKFDSNTKFIMVSATVDEKVCEYYFGRNMTFYECAAARNTGVLTQYYNRSLSRADIDKDTGIFKQIKKLSGFENTISFKKYLDAGLYSGELHFGNCAGCDYLKGHDIDVIGTPHQPEWIYKLFASSLPDLDFDINARIKPGATVEHNGHRFRFTTYDNEALRVIQFYMIESQSEQAVGRSRLLRCDCNVNLFSNFPLRQAVMKAAEYDKPVEE